MSFDKIFVTKKLEMINEYTGELEEMLKLPDKEIFSDHAKLHAVERLAQLIVDLMLDINQHFIRELNLKIPEELKGTFAILGEKSILPIDFAEKIAPLTGVRNILVHQYEKIDRELLMRNLRKNFSDFQKYERYIFEYSDKL